MTAKELRELTDEELKEISVNTYLYYTKSSFC